MQNLGFALPLANKTYKKLWLTYLAQIAVFLN